MGYQNTTCAECGGPVIQQWRGRPRRFCSDKCKAKAGNTRARRALLPLRQSVEKVCRHCGKTFTVTGKRDRTYCYDSWCAQSAYRQRKQAGEAKMVVAHDVTCDECGARFVARYPSARWCSKSCANRYWGRIRSRQRSVLSDAKYTDREIFERDGWSCYLCGEQVRMDVPRLHPLGATIDHVVPLSRGGIDEPSNLRTAHWRCNSLKGSSLNSS